MTVTSIAAPELPALPERIGKYRILRRLVGRQLPSPYIADAQGLWSTARCGMWHPCAA